jgi:hypothetical protein
MSTCSGVLSKSLLNTSSLPSKYEKKVKGIHKGLKEIQKGFREDLKRL